MDSKTAGMYGPSVQPDRTLVDALLLDIGDRDVLCTLPEDLFAKGREIFITIDDGREVVSWEISGGTGDACIRVGDQ